MQAYLRQYGGQVDNRRRAQLTLTHPSKYPIDGKIGLHLNLSRSSQFAIRLRIPAWSTLTPGTTLHVNHERVPLSIASGFVTLQRTWKDGDRVDQTLHCLYVCRQSTRSTLIMLPWCAARSCCLP
jgi:DUF1680 family protein